MGSGSGSAVLLCILRVAAIMISASAGTGGCCNNNNLQFLTLDLSDNMFTGSIPNYPYAEYLNLSHNNLSGNFLYDLIFVKDVDISYNSLQGSLPDYFIAQVDPSRYIGNPELCGNAASLPSCFAPKPIVQRAESKYCIGAGGYGSVYRAHLLNGEAVALKKIHRLEGENPIFLESFRNEARMLSSIRHRNIVKLFGFCLHRKCMFLIYEYMERGSLFCILRNDMEAVELNWMERWNVIKGLAHALSYMHHDCSSPIVHRDVTTNNILLDSEMEATLSDFGTARILQFDSSNQTIRAGTCGYIAPGTVLICKIERL